MTLRSPSLSLSLSLKNPFTPPHLTALSGLPNRPGWNHQWWTENDPDKLWQGITLRGTAHTLLFHTPPIRPTGVAGMRLDRICHYWLLHLPFHFSAARCCRLTSAVRTERTQASHRLQPPLIPLSLSLSLSLPSRCVSSILFLSHKHNNLTVLFLFPSLSINSLFLSSLSRKNPSLR